MRFLSIDDRMRASMPIAGVLSGPVGCEQSRATNRLLPLRASRERAHAGERAAAVPAAVRVHRVRASLMRRADRDCPDEMRARYERECPRLLPWVVDDPLEVRSSGFDWRHSLSPRVCHTEVLAHLREKVRLP